ncbi:MAG: carbohydrate kinase [Methylococcales bacterium]|nr:carbohydrate kinase [Methylococcales bacterium]
MSDKPAVWIFGEVLFDHFPDGARVLGGAPFNVAWHLQAFGLSPLFISRIGADQAGREIAARMDGWGMDRTAVQTDAEHPTGSVRVRIEDGEPHYDIVAGSAYDFIDSRLLDSRPGSGILYHGTLALRNPVSLAALQSLKAQQRGGIFVDVNLRSPWWQAETLPRLLHDADWVKLNQAEFELLKTGGGGLETAMAAFCERFALQTLIVTRGEKGAIACDRLQHFAVVEPPSATRIVDTVGAGDAFAAVLLLGMSRQWPLETALERAQAFAAALVGRRGATIADQTFYQAFQQSWRL